MAAMRSPLAMLGRRSCGYSGSSAAASVGRGGLEIRHVLRPATGYEMSRNPSNRTRLETVWKMPIQ
uniref:Uncharacterized protein n=1 Tax=Setaria viridis TaxID=4556 RepID=A0A4U6UDA7_SETVI|nr:hypothetical protein SEVIR_5G135201v2 [Setaria viridis]